MKDQETIARFIALRAQGRTLSAIATELNVSKPTLVDWGRKFQFDIQNLRVVELEALAEKHLASRAQRWEQLEATLRRVEAELANRKLEDVPTARLISLAAALRDEAARETGGLRFSKSVREIPREEYVGDVMDWQA
jgi:orotate phosphoribosyltransferase-like protein